MCLWPHDDPDLSPADVSRITATTGSLRSLITSPSLLWASKESKALRKALGNAALLVKPPNQALMSALYKAATLDEDDYDIHLRL